MKNFISKILDEPESEPVFKFMPQIKVSSKSTLHLQIQPSDPHTASNIVLNAFQSKTNRLLVPIKVEWSRYKFKSDEQFTVQKIPSLIGNTYMCEPSDLGSVIQAKVKCLDSSLDGQAEATIGPIRIDPMLKRLIDGALYNGSLLSQVIVIEADQKLNIDLRMGKNTLQFKDPTSSQELTIPYSLSQPKVQLSPKDPCKVYLRFEQDSTNSVRTWLDKVTRQQKNQRNSSNGNLNESSLSIRVPHSNVSSITSKTKLFQRSHVHCVNKLQVRFLSRNSRDLFLFTLRAFVCKQDMKNSVVMERIETLQGLKSEQDYNKFLSYISLKSQIVRLAENAKQLQQDRDAKVRDISNMQESISEMTSTYMKIIEAKSQEQHVDLEQSYSMISMKREEIMGRRNLRELRAENQKLKTHIRELNEQIELQKFFKKDANEQSMVFNQTSNPFLKKQNISGIIDQNQSTSYYLAGQEVRPHDPAHKNMLEISKSYLKVLEENKKLKEMSGSKKGSHHDKSMGIENLLESLHESEEEEKKMAELQVKMHQLKGEVERLAEQNMQLLSQNTGLKQRLMSLPPMGTNPLMNNSLAKSPFKNDQSIISNPQNNTSLISQSYISMNQSMTSEAELGLLQKKLIELAGINAKFESENARLRRERDYFRALHEAEVGKDKSVLLSRDRQLAGNNRHSLEDSMMLNGSGQESVMKLKEERENLQNEKNALLKKIDSLTRESNVLHPKTDPSIERRISELTHQNQQLLEENDSLKKTVSNIKSFHQLEKRQLLNSRSPTSTTDHLFRPEEMEKIKKINASLLNEVKQLRIEIERKNDSYLDNSRVINLENQLHVFRTYAQGGSHLVQNQLLNIVDGTVTLQEQTQKLMGELTQVRNQNQRLKEQIVTLQLKIKTQTSTIQKLMAEIDQLHNSPLNTSNASSTFNKKYLTPESSPQKLSSHDTEAHHQQIQKYRKKLTEVQGELEVLRRNSEAFNRSRDLSMSMMGYEEERLQLYKKENESLQVEIDNLNKMCSKYSKDAREANLELNKLKNQVILMNKVKLQISD